MQGVPLSCFNILNTSEGISNLAVMFQMVVQGRQVHILAPVFLTIEMVHVVMNILGYIISIFETDHGSKDPVEPVSSTLLPGSSARGKISTRNHEPFDPEKVGLVGVLLFTRWLTGLCIISGLSLLTMKWIPSIKS
jgi:hypothetical protein